MMAWYSVPQLARAEQLMLEAGQGLFRPHADGSPAAAAEVERRAYKIRPACAADIPRLESLERECWIEPLRASRAAIERRLSRFPEGQLVLVEGGSIAGVVYSRRIRAIDSLYSTTAHQADAAHFPDGSVLQLLAINIAPEVQDRQWGEQLLEFMLEVCTAAVGLTHVVGVTRCSSFRGTGHSQLREYIRQCDATGRPLDPVLRFHHEHGGRIAEIVVGYRPEDLDNEGCGVLVEYELAQRIRRRSSPRVDTSDEHLAAGPGGREKIAAGVAEAVAAVAQLDELPADWQSFPLMEIGLDSADLLALNHSIGSRFGVTLNPLFFFKHNTGGKVVDFLAAHKPERRAGTSCDFAQLPSTLPEAAPIHAEVRARDVAIVGMAFRLPRGMASREALWDLLAQGNSVVTALPPDRWRWPAGIDPGGSHRGIDRGGFLEDAFDFDAGFFRVLPRDAREMDPQQRIALELAWACLEDAGYAARDLAGTDTGVFIGVSGSDYRHLAYERQSTPLPQTNLGTATALIPNRISYFFDLRGPSVQVDTVCSSSLVAVHQAIEAVRAGRCQQALVGGVHVMCHPGNSISYHAAGMLAADGRCKTFDASADGYVRSEGAVLLLLKPLHQAAIDGDHIYGVLKGSAVNHGGAAGGITVPNSTAQADLVSAAMRDAGVEPESITYIEAHGTGTALGDPLEVEGLREAFAVAGPGGEESSADAAHRHDPWCGLGSVKTNVGHLEAAAGVAGLLKVLLCFEHQQIPPSAHFQRLNPKIRLEGSPFHVVTRETPWAVPDGRPRRAGVSSFGCGGTNAHVVLEEHIFAPSVAGSCVACDSFLIVLSAKTVEGLRERARQLVGAIGGGEGAECEGAECEGGSEGLSSIAYTLQVGREEMEQRLGVQVRSKRELRQKLEEYLGGSWPIGGMYAGEAGKQKEGLRVLGGDEDGRGLLQEWMRKGKGGQVLQLWVQGMKVEWEQLYEGRRPRRVSLPTYPFARERYW
ncbi:MAG TPA: beta-ketoacyl synthase N-terminal-like domain-containing protein, partial [Steroidobacteraceae bacterium]